MREKKETRRISLNVPVELLDKIQRCADNVNVNRSAWMLMSLSNAVATSEVSDKLNALQDVANLIKLQQYSGEPLRELGRGGSLSDDKIGNSQE